MLRKTLLWRQRKTEPWGQPTFRMVEKEGQMPKEMEKALNNANQDDLDQRPSEQEILGKNYGQLCQWV